MLGRRLIVSRKWNGVWYELITEWERRHREWKGGKWFGELNGYKNVDRRMMMGDWRWGNDDGICENMNEGMGVGKGR